MTQKFVSFTEQYLVNSINLFVVLFNTGKEEIIS